MKFDNIRRNCLTQIMTIILFGRQNSTIGGKANCNLNTTIEF